MQCDTKRSVSIVASNKRSFLVPYSDAKNGTSSSGTATAQLATLGPTPSSAELLRLTCSLLRCEQLGLLERGLDLCATTADALLREATEQETRVNVTQASHNVSTTMANNATSVTPQSMSSTLYSPQEGEMSNETPLQQQHQEEVADHDALGESDTRRYRTPAALRLQAVYLLVAGVVTAMAQYGMHTMQQRAVQLAERAARVTRSAMTHYAMAMAYDNMARSYTDAESRAYWASQAVTAALQTVRCYRTVPDAATTSAATVVDNQPAVDKPVNVSDATLGALPPLIITPLPTTTAAAAQSSSPAVLLEDDIPFISRLCWLLAQYGQVSEARACNAAILQCQPTHYMALLLSALDSSAASDYDATTATTLLLLQHYSDDVVAALLLALVHHMTSHTTDSTSNSGKELAVALARAQAFAAQPQPRAGPQHTLKSLSLHAGPYESPFAEEAMMSLEEWRCRAAGHWALVAYVCIQLGAYEIAEAACEAEMEFVMRYNATNRPPRRAYAALLCHRVRLFLASVIGPRVAAAFATGAAVRTTNYVLRDMRFLSLRLPQPHTVLSPSVDDGPHGFRASLPMIAAETNAVDEFASEREAARAALSRLITHGEWLALWSLLTRALELWPDEAEVFHLMGCMHLIQACPAARDALLSQIGDSSSERAIHLDEAVRCFETALRHVPQLSEAYYGLGAAREEQGMWLLSVDAYATAAELIAQEPLIRYTDLAYLYE